MTDSKSKKKIEVNEEYCKECSFCIHFCPDDALKLQEKFNSRGFHPVVWTGNCSFCGRCYMVCPDCAIEIIEND
ncbi:4Fe-4S dicluster domain-containing protein [Elusimicrobiota bacterium]